MPKTEAERSKAYRERKRAKAALIATAKKKPAKSGAQRLREFRARQKALNAAESDNVNSQDNEQFVTPSAPSPTSSAFSNSEHQHSEQHTPTNNFSSERSCYKAPNLLPLDERIQVISQYEQSPNYKRIADRFNCSVKQIRNIIANKDSLLLCAASAQRTRIEKIKFLDKVIYEYILRALHQHIPINEQIVRSKALTVKETLGIDNFCPYQIWLEHFKKSYGILDLDSESLRKTVNETSKELSVSCIDLIQYISRIERKAEREKAKRARTSTAQHKKYTVETDDSVSNEDMGEPTIVYENAINYYYREIGTNDVLNLNNQESMTITLESDLDDDDGAENDKMTSSIENGQSNVPLKRERLPDITNFQEALLHLKALEEFALLESNFRAIGLITQLEQAIQNPPKNIDFSN